MKHIAKQALGACFSLVLAASSAAATTVQDVADLRTTLTGFSKMLEDGPDLRTPASHLLEESGLLELVDIPRSRAIAPAIMPAPVTQGMIDAKAIDLRFALGLIAQIYGAKDNQDVLEAQADPAAQALVIYQGVVTLPEIFKQLDRLGLQSAADSADGVLRVPVVIWADGALRLGPQDVVTMSRTHGAFLANFGQLDINGTVFRTVGEASPTNTDFIPFVVNAGGASVQMRNAVVDGLGFGSEGKFGGFSLVRNPLMVRRNENILENNTFNNIMGVTVSMADGIVVRHNRISNTRGPSLVVTHSLDAQIVGNLISGKAPTNAIRLLQGSARGVIAGNVVLQGSRTGIVVRNDSNDVVLRGNVVWRRSGGGISVAKSRCAIIEDNVVMDNRQKGVEVRSVSGATIQNNKIWGNNSAGLWVSDQDKGVATRLSGNDVVGNGSGVATASGEIIVLEGNDLTNQFPRFFDGDLSLQGRLINSNLDGAVPVVLTAGGVFNGPAPQVGCDF